MQTLRLRIDPERLGEPEAQAALDQAAAILRRGGTVALPTETVYGLGANALDAQAVALIFAAKARPGWDPLIVHVSDAAMLALVTCLTSDLPESARQLITAFWPGPLTLLLPRSTSIPDAVTAGRALVGVRMPAHPVALALIRRAGVPIAAPSANRFGHTSPTTAQHVLDDLDGRIDAVIDAGPTACGVESTVLDPQPSPMVIYRPGAVTAEQIQEVAGPVSFFSEGTSLATSDDEAREGLPSPGVGLRHYAPQARLILVESENIAESLLAAAARLSAAMPSGEILGVMLPAGLPGQDAAVWSRLQPRPCATFPWGNWNQPETLAQQLFAGLRYLDSLGCTVILCPVPAEQGIGSAIRDRLRKAAFPA